MDMVTFVTPKKGAANPIEGAAPLLYSPSAS